MIFLKKTILMINEVLESLIVPPKSKIIILIINKSCYKNKLIFQIEPLGASI